MSKGIELLQALIEKHNFRLALSAQPSEPNPFKVRVESPGYGLVECSGKSLDEAVRQLDIFLAATGHTDTIEVATADRYLVAWILYPFVEIDELPPSTQVWIRTGKGENVEKYNHMARRVAAHRQDAIRKAQQG